MTEHFIRYYENVVDDEFCDNLIEKFEQNEDKHLSIKSGDKFSFKELTKISITTYKNISKHIKHI